MKKWKRLLYILFLGPLLPIIGVPDGENINSDGDGGDVDGENNSDENNSNNEDNNNSNNNNENNTENSKSFSAQELEEKIQARLAREKKKIEKQIRNEFETQKKRENMTELEKIKADLETEKKANEDRIFKSKQRLIKSEVKSIGTELNIIDVDVAYKLLDMENIDVTDSDDVVGVKEALESLIKDKPYLIKSNNQTNKNIGDDQNKNTGGSKENQTMNQLIRSYFRK